ncbi:iron-sulfur cluster assembly scaffold protein, partial [bacterium]|nr:iron-sulfur cluster assembly scaffold protein [bacterium]
MSAELEELYQSIILDHNRRPQNFRVMEDASGHADGLNPLCGDQV